MPRRTRNRMERRTESQPAQLLDLTSEPDKRPLLERPRGFHPRQPYMPTDNEVAKAVGKREREAAARQREAAIRNGIEPPWV